MKAAVTTKAGRPEVIQIKEAGKPEPKDGWVTIKVKAFGLNRSELFTRQGHSPGVNFPIIQGIECVGEVEYDPTESYQPGQKVAAIMGGMGRQFDGSYAEYTRVPLLIRGGSSSIGMLACQLGKYYGLTVISTTRNPNKTSILQNNGADHVLIDDGQISTKVFDLYPGGVDKVLELVGTDTLKDSLQCIRPKGIVCMTGILSGWTVKEFSPMEYIPRMGRLTAYAGDAENLEKAALQDLIDAVEQGMLRLNIDRTYPFEQVAEAHAYMESNQNAGKIVVEI